jgi:hypothetical protein
MKDKQICSVEWFIEQLEEKGKAYEENQVVRTINICIDVSDYMELKIQAKQMNRNEIAQAFDNGDYNYFYSKKTGNDFEDGQEYFNEVHGEEQL